ncbi:hypothetical protein CsSME_00015797 [Camellia sinensis var. sinensis]
MDNKTWLWRKRSSEKTIVANNKSDFSSQGIEEEILATEKEASLERSLENLNEKLASVICEVNAKDELLARHAKIAEEAIADREKAEAAAVSLKQELDKALQQKISSNERLTQLNTALKESTHQLSLVREEQEQRIRDAVMKTSKEFEKAQKKLEEKLTEKSEMLANLTVENSRLSKAFLVNEKLMEDLSKHKSQAEVEFNTLMARLDSVEKENDFLKYEFRMLEKELEIRNEEIEFNRLAADVSHKQHMESEKKISKLEAECQRLRVLVRKRLPGPAALAKMKSEVEILGQNQSEMRRKSNPITGSLIVRDSGIANPPDIPNKKISFLIERLYDVEEENKTLKEILAKKEDELHFSQIVCAQTASKLSTVEAQLGEHSKGEKSVELAHKIFGVSDMSLMDDFVEMEKLAIVTVDTPMGNSYTSLDASNVLAISSDESGGYHLDPSGKELVPVVQGQSSDIKQEIQTKDESTRKGYDWLQDVLKLILDQNHKSKRSFDDLLEDIRIGLSYMNYSCDSEANKEESSNRPAASAPIPISGYITWKSPNISSKVGSLDGVPHSETWVEETTDQHSQPNMNSSIRKTIELIRRIDPASLKNGYVLDNCLERDRNTYPFKLLPTPSEYLVCVFRWKSCVLGTVLQQFVRTCDDLLDGKVKFENFAAELTSALDWIINNCIISSDVSIMRDEIKKRLDFDKSPSAIKLGGVDSPFSESDKVHRSEEHSMHVWEENMGLKDELKNMESSQKDQEARLRSANDKSEALMNQVRESERSIGNLQMELKSLKESKGMVEDQMESQKLINEDLDTQLTVTKVKLNEVVHKLSSLEVELDDKCQCCEELKATCLELQLQLESITSKEVLKDNIDQEERLLQTGWEITAASAKLAECQETILNLGKQLNALASQRETSVFNKVVSTTNNKKLRQWSPLRDRMLAVDDAETGDLNSPKTKEIIRSTVEAKKPSIPEACIGSKREAHTAAAVGSLAIVPSKKRRGGVGFLRKLLMRRKRGNIKKTSQSFAT